MTPAEKRYFDACLRVLPLVQKNDDNAVEVVLFTVVTASTPNGLAMSVRYLDTNDGVHTVNVPWAGAWLAVAGKPFQT